jgi:hypothetical protein
MKRFIILTGMALTLCAFASANIIPTNTTITTGAGPFTWTYDLQLSSDQNVNSGAAPTVNPVAQTNVGQGGFLTIYDFAGYVAGSCKGPTGWTCTAQNVGFTPSDVVPIDNTAVANITWTYTSGATILGQPSGVDLGLFSAVSIYNTPTQVSYAARGIKNLGGQTGTISDNVGNTSGPTFTPEPASLVTMGAGLGLLGLGLVGRRKAKGLRG